VTPQPRIAVRLALFHGGFLLVCLALAGALLLYQDAAERDRRALLDEALPRFSDMLAVSRLGDALAETAATLAAAADVQDRAAALKAMASARAELAARIATLGNSRLETATRERLTAAMADMTDALDTLDALVGRRIGLANVAGLLNARLALLGELLPDLERGLLSGKEPDLLDGIVDMDTLDFPSGPSSTAAANAMRTWARNAQVAVGMMLAASGAPDIKDLDYLEVRAEESLRRAAASIRATDRSARPLLEAVQAAMTAVAAGRDGNDSVFRVRRQHLTLSQNTPAVLTRGRQASDRLTAAVAQIIADLEQARAVQNAQQARANVVWRLGVGLLAGLGVTLAVLSVVFLWRAVVCRARRMSHALLSVQDGAALTLPDRDLWPDELGVVAHAIEALDAERRRIVLARREQAARLSAVFAAGLDAILVLTADRHVEDLNPVAERLFGMPGTTLLGRPLASILPDAAAVSAVEAEILRALKDPLTARDPVVVMLPCPKGGGHPATMLSVAVTATGAPANGGTGRGEMGAGETAGDGGGPLIVLVLRDRTRTRRVEDIRGGGRASDASRVSNPGDRPYVS